MPKATRGRALLAVVRGGEKTLSATHGTAVAQAAGIIRDLSPTQAEVLVALIDEFRRDGSLQRVRDFDLPAVKILAEVINGWDPDGVYEFARAWTSTLVSRLDGFHWSTCDAKDKEEHWRRVQTEMARRGLAHHSI